MFWLFQPKILWPVKGVLTRQLVKRFDWSITRLSSQNFYLYIRSEASEIIFLSTVVQKLTTFTVFSYLPSRLGTNEQSKFIMNFIELRIILTALPILVVLQVCVNATQEQNGIKMQYRGPRACVLPQFSNIYRKICNGDWRDDHQSLLHLDKWHWGGIFRPCQWQRTRLPSKLKAVPC